MEPKYISKWSHMITLHLPRFVGLEWGIMNIWTTWSIIVYFYFVNEKQCLHCVYEWKPTSCTKQFLVHFKFYTVCCRDIDNCDIFRARALTSSEIRIWFWRARDAWKLTKLGTQVRRDVFCCVIWVLELGCGKGAQQRPLKISKEEPQRYVSPRCTKFGRHMYHLQT